MANRIGGVSKSTVSKNCKDIDERACGFLNRPFAGERLHVWLDATYLKVRQAAFAFRGFTNRLPFDSGSRTGGDLVAGAGRLAAMIDAVDCDTHVEPLVGMGGIFLRRRRRPRCEMINDAGRDVANLFRILQRHYPQFIETIRFQLNTRAEFERLVATDPTTLTNLERAARFLYPQRCAFGGKVSGRNFGVSPDRPGRFNLTTLEPMLEDLHGRLSGVIIGCLDFAEPIRRYDRPTALFHLEARKARARALFGQGGGARENGGEAM